ncbi:putative ethanolamine phosphotransferase [Leptomonas pyrrhocoris]|uniref:Putative ethanolamine phosphotransferase n=1 Tax=Leptomonas pyrrhocoris TaxID=157538 RepID=A0A0N0DUJ5_LEPPY|nr:putative ethanolamine phosphotransferase [Leptomonas pyrrhocoris]KPA79034.1 putative ethanolamine phosphotransferase [Leptomonas pyrrhocoris]|eukprot:XP_015657473.1 putative ethanolamine phosphotransferase [Leptomonas pyrrhocoris]
MLSRLLAQWPLLVLVLFYAASVLLFCTSMLSTSTVMRNFATEPCTGTVATPVDQVVLILIDAMRPDFVLSALRPFARTGGQCDVHGDHSLAAIWADNRYTGPTLHYMEESLRSESDASIAYFLVADTPTTTAQRIKAIATGTMPAFLEAGSNFNSDAIELDSIIGQMNGSAVLLGDDTWEKLFPNTPTKRHWKHAVGVPSFDVADFDTNDDAVLGEVYEVLRRETREAVAAAATVAPPPAGEAFDRHAGLVVAHFLGIDHIGHRVDSDNPYMKGKIRQLDEMLRNVSQLLRERPTSMHTMLLVMGDHGMTNSGDHGGGSAQETDTFLFAQYFPGARSAAPTPSSNSTTTASSTAANLRRARQLLQQRWRDRVDAEFDRLRSCRAAAGVPLDKLGATYQVDVTATMAVLLGRPIPYSSFGRVIPEVLTLANASTNVEAVEQCNLRQLERYFQESAMKIPPDASWMRPGASVTQRLADMSYYARRTRTDMHRSGMFIGSTGLLLCAMSLLWSPTIRTYLSPRRSGWLMTWTVLVLVLRLCSVFSNSFVVNEDSELLGLLCSLLLLLSVPRVMAAVKMTGAPKEEQSGLRPAGSCSRCIHWGTSFLAALRRTDAAFLGVLLLGLRLAVPVLLRYRAHITHTVETESAVDRFVSAHAALQIERSGIFTASVLWVALYPRAVPWPVVGGTAVAVACVYHVPVAHHTLPLLCAVVCPHWCKVASHSSATTKAPRTLPCRPYRYLVLILWLSSLCNGKVATAVTTATYGVVLPRLCRVLRAAPLLTQATALHFFAFVVFFAEGHQCMLNTIDWNASFVGMPFYNMYLGAVLVLSRTFHAFMLVPLALGVSPQLEHRRLRRFTPAEEAVARAKRVDDTPVGTAAQQTTHENTNLPDDGGGRDATTVVLAVYLYLLLVQSAVSCFNGYIQKTHLMLFPIFCPKLLFDAVIALLTSGVVLVSVTVF